MKVRISNQWLVGASTLLIAILLSVGLWEPSVVAQTTAPATSRNGAVRINNTGQTTWDEVRGIGRMQENVRVTQDGEDFILYCEELFYDRNTNQARAKGKLRVESRDSTIIGNEIRANFNTKMIVVTGNVTMKSHGTDDGIKGSDSKKATEKRSLREEVKGKSSRMACDRIDYNYENRQAVITGSIRLVQEKNSGTCERIIFDEEKNIAQLTSTDPYGVKFTDEKGRTILTRDVIVYIDQDHVQTKFPVKIDIPRPNNAPAPAPVEPRREFPTPDAIPDNPFADEPATAPPAATGAPTPAAADKSAAKE